MTIEMNQDLSVQVYLHGGNTFMSSEGIAASAAGDGGVSTGDMGGDASGGMTTGAGSTVKDPLLSNWPFVIGISFLTLAIGVTIGILLAKRKIKKGIELYED